MQYYTILYYTIVAVVVVAGVVVAAAIIAGVVVVAAVEIHRQNKFTHSRQIQLQCNVKMRLSRVCGNQFDITQV